MIHSQGQHTAGATINTLLGVCHQLSPQVHCQAMWQGPKAIRKGSKEQSLSFSPLTEAQYLLFKTSALGSNGRTIQENAPCAPKALYFGLENPGFQSYRISCFLATRTAASHCLWQGGRWPKYELQLGKETQTRRPLGRKCQNSHLLKVCSSPGSLRQGAAVQLL